MPVMLKSSFTPFCLLAAALQAAFGALPAAATTLFPAGPESKTAGIESSLLSAGPPAVLYNPANLAIPKSPAGGGETYAELGMINVSYAYEHPDFDPVVISVTSPTATIGYSAELTPRLTASGVIFPSSDGKTEIPGLPRKVGGSMMALEVENQDQVIDTGAGLAAQITDDFTAGLSLVHTTESHKTRANVPGNDDPLIAMNYRNQFNRPVFGLRYARQDRFAATAALRPALVKKFKGHQTSAVDLSSAPKIQSYEPETLSVGLGGSYKGFRAGFEAQRQTWSKGRNIVKDGVAADLPAADLKDVTELSFTSGYQFAAGRSLALGVAEVPTPWGDGKDDGIVDHHEHGVDFGQLNGIDQRIYSLGGELRSTYGDLSLSFFRADGHREVRGAGDNVGYYSLGVTSVSGSFGKSF